MVNSPPSLLGYLDEFESFDNTPVIGTTFPNPSTQLSKFLDATNSDDLLRDLAKLVSHRGVVFFCAQDINVFQQKELAKKLGELSGKPKSSGLHVHPISEDLPELGADVSVISSKGGIAKPDVRLINTRASAGWHSDITFEPVPSDYAILKMHTLPEVGGDTLWASGYEAYDKLSPAYQKFLEGLTAVHHAESFIEYAARNNFQMNDKRGSPENTGTSLTAIHPVIRTHPLTGFRTLFVNREFTKRIPELSPEESENTLRFLQLHISENHDLQVRYRWKVNDVAIWDNRATLHTATNDYGDQFRQGNRVVSIGERPYFDPNSKSRRAALGDPHKVVPDVE